MSDEKFEIGITEECTYVNGGRSITASSVRLRRKDGYSSLDMSWLDWLAFIVRLLELLSESFDSIPASDRDEAVRNLAEIRRLVRRGDSEGFRRLLAAAELLEGGNDE